MLSEKPQWTQNGTMFVDLDWLLNASSPLSASAELVSSATGLSTDCLHKNSHTPNYISFHNFCLHCWISALQLCLILRGIDSAQDYVHQVVCITEREKFVVPIRAVGARGILDFPDEIALPACAVKHTQSRVLLVRNIGNADAAFSLTVDKYVLITFLLDVAHFHVCVRCLLFCCYLLTFCDRSQAFHYLKSYRVYFSVRPLCLFVYAIYIPKVLNYLSMTLSQWIVSSNNGSM